MKWVADTNALSELRKPSPDVGVVRWFADTPSEYIFTTSVNLAEIRFGIEVQKDPARAKLLETWLERTIRPMFAERVLDADEAAIVAWRFMSVRAQKAGRPAPSVDLLIAAIASVNTCAVVTRDAAPFAAAGVPVFNPWTNERFHLG